MVYSALCMALAMVLPFLTGQIQTIGQMLAPMHIPVLICGFICGWPWGLAVGFISPLLRFAIFGMPPIMPAGISMAFELAAYGFITGFLYKKLPKKTSNIYFSLFIAMIAGRCIWGLARIIIAGASGNAFTFSAFLAGAVTSAIPGIILQIILVPVLVMALDKAKLNLNK